MRIYSNYYDYYDNISAFGADSNTVYNREIFTIDREEISLAPYQKIRSKLLGKLGLKRGYFRTDISSNWFYSANEEIRVGYLGFCGKAYPVFFTPWGVTSCYRGILKLLDRTIVEQDYPKLFEELNTVKSKSVVKYFTRKKAEEIQNIDNSFEIPSILFQQINSPCYLYIGKTKSKINWDRKNFKKGNGFWSYEQNLLVANPILSEISFQYLLDPFTTFQAINQYLSGVLTIREEPAIADNKTLLQAHGFDEKSFKQSSPGKKAKRRRKSA